MAPVLRRIPYGLTWCVSLLILACGNALAIPTLTAEGVAQGFTLTQFADQFPNASAVGPLGIAFDGSKVIVSDYPGNVRVFPNKSDGQHAPDAPVAQSFGQGNAVGIARSGDFLYMAQQSAGKVVRLKLDGTFHSDVVDGIGTATGIFANPVTGKLFVSSCCSNNGIWEVDPVTNTKTQFKASGNYDGLSINAAGTVIYAEIGGHIIGYRLSDGVQVFDSGFFSGADGTELGAGSLAGKIFILTNGGNVYEVDLATPSDVDLLVTGGTRGDFVTADPNGSLLLTFTSDIWRLTPEAGGCIGASCNNVPEPNALALIAIGLLGAAGSRIRKVRRQY